MFSIQLSYVSMALSLLPWTKVVHFGSLKKYDFTDFGKNDNMRVV